MQKNTVFTQTVRL